MTHPDRIRYLLQMKLLSQECHRAGGEVVQLSESLMPFPLFIFSTTPMSPTGPLDLSSFGKLKTFARYYYTYIIHKMHINIRMHSHYVVAKNGEKNIKYGYQTETSGYSDRQTMII